MHAPQRRLALLALAQAHGCVPMPACCLSRQLPSSSFHRLVSISTFPFSACLSALLPPALPHDHRSPLLHRPHIPLFTLSSPHYCPNPFTHDILPPVAYDRQLSVSLKTNTATYDCPWLQPRASTATTASTNTNPGRDNIIMRRQTPLAHILYNQCGASLRLTPKS